MKSLATRRFWASFRALPKDVQELAVQSYHRWRLDPHHPSLRFRRLQGSKDRFTVRVGNHYRALGIVDENTITWVWIGTHAEYDQLLGN